MERKKKPPKISLLEIKEHVKQALGTCCLLWLGYSCTRTSQQRQRSWGWRAAASLLESGLASTAHILQRAS